MMLFSRLRRGGDGAVGRPVVQDPEASGESEVFRDPRERPRMERDDVLVY
jgi:hypothetical protein